MIIFRTLLRWTRRAALILFALLFLISFFTLLSAEKGTLLTPSYARVISVNGVVLYINQHAMGGSKNLEPWALRLAWLSDEEARGIIYRGAFDWSTMGFRLISSRTLPRGRPPAIESIGFIVPYWPVLLLLLIPEIRPWMRRARASNKNMPPMQSQRVESSTITGDLPCVHCGYNLQTLSTTSLCPECGNAIVDTLTLNAELARSRPGWLKSLASGNVLLLLTRVLLIVVYLQFGLTTYGPSDYVGAGICALGAAGCYMAGSYLLTLNEHPFLRSPDRANALRQRIGAIIVFLCVAAAIYHQTFIPSAGRWGVVLLPPWLMWSGYGFWHLPFLVLLLAGWLLYCFCTILEYRFLGKLAGRLLDRFMTEHCIIAGIGAGLTNLLALWIVRDFVTHSFIHGGLVNFWITFAVIVLWILFQIWTGFMNVYCASRFIQQAWLAEEHWRARQTGPQLVQR